MTELPAPLVPAEVDLSGYQFMPLYGHRLFGSEFNARCSDGAWRAGVTLWWAAWNQVPAASLPDDDVALCRLADLGRDVKAWRKMREEALHGFVKCSDGRLYHRALSEYALDAWDRRVRDRERKAKWRAGRNADGDGDKTAPETGTGAGQRRDVPADRDRERDRERDSELRSTSSLRSDAAHGGASPGDGAGADDRGRGVAEAPRGTRLPADWPLTAELIEIAERARTDARLPPIDVALEHAKFADYWRARTGAKATSLDWRATWRNWIRRSTPEEGHGRQFRGAGRAPIDLEAQRRADRLAVLEGCGIAVAGRGGADHEGDGLGDRADAAEHPRFARAGRG